MMNALRSARFLLVLCLLGHAEAQTFDQMVAQGRLNVRVTLSPEGEVAVTQRILLKIEIATATRFFGKKNEIKNPEIPGALVMQRLTYSPRTREDRSGAPWRVESREMEVYPQSPGVHEIPPIEIEVSVRDDRLGRVKGKLRTPPFRFEAVVPPGAPPDVPWVATSDLKVAESWDLPLDAIRAGAARRREVTLTAENLAAMLLPPLSETSIPDVSIYPRPPELIDDMTVSKADGVRKESRTYFFEAPVSVTLPEQHFHWWNVKARQWEVTTLPARTLGIHAAGTGSSASAPGESTPIWVRLKRILVLTLITSALSWLLAGWLRKPIQISAKRLRPWLTHRESRRRRWRNLRHALEKGSAPEVVESLYQWIGAPGVTLRQFASHEGDSAFELLIEELLTQAYGRQPGSFVRSRELKKALERARRARWLRPWARSRSTSFDLAHLNPQVLDRTRGEIGPPGAGLHVTNLLRTEVSPPLGETEG